MTISDEKSSILDQIPSANREPVDAVPSRVAATKPRPSRRGVFGLALGVATAAGLGALDLLPGSRPRSAAAAVYKTVWDTCKGFINASSVCVPSSAYYGSDNCTGSWHRDDGYSGTCVSINYTSYADSCAGRNAWRWTGGSTTSKRRKCSDGYRYVVACGASGSGQFSICRTTI
ncbi:hypothetical protein ACIBF7_30795 [Nonomuraea sp. NPDC050478]|uniref:Twin-arginine translocation signal domain-containing protein n=1 Tax=Nonomuraea harbinensis TaxID=1286938 RepID=A0ABW1BT13_9ACTN|nr:MULTISPECIES: hypothetical protein [Nonomuraea]TXK38849.1 hypothetical protein FR742_04050 [Nonomuraea sp. C10]